MSLRTGLAALSVGLAAVGAGLATPARAVALDLAARGHGPGSRPVAVFRVDVSRYPHVGLVVTVPQPHARQVTVKIGAATLRPRLSRLWPGDLQLVLALDSHLAAAALRAEQAAAARFVVGLPSGAQTAALPRLGAQTLTSDPTAAVAVIGALAPSARPRTELPPAATRMAAALAAFSAGPRVRRTVVLVISSDEPLSPSAAHHLHRQLAASGTALYVLDASHRGATSYDALAAGTGGFASRLRALGDWRTAFRRIIAALTEQYYLRFIDTAPLPGRALITVETANGPARGVVELPVANPVAPPPIAAKPGGRPALPDWPLVWLAVALIVGVGCYGLALLAASRRDPRRLAGQSGDCGRELFFVFLLPCLNEEKVIGNSLRRLLSMPGDNFVIMVIDDGSDDGTVDVVSRLTGDRVWLLRRTAPHARQGKGEALNAAVRHLSDNRLLDDRDPANVIVVIVDADGRLEPHSIAVVSPCFADPKVGAVQIGVRINNRDESLLARMQDMEFVIYTEVFQRGRRHLGSVGLGGNGQFMRLSALRALGPAPWTRSLTDDLDLGVRLLAAGWRNEYCSAAAVHQQGVVELKRLIRQRSRWFQGHLQSWKLVPILLRSAPRRARADLLYHLSSPAILLIASLLSASFVASAANFGLVAADGGNPFGWWIGSTYALTFGPALIFSYVYWTRERSSERASGTSLLRIAGFAHLYVCYGLMWYAAGWWAVGRTLRGRTGWAKTDRVAEATAGAQAPPPGRGGGRGRVAGTGRAKVGGGLRRRRRAIAVPLAMAAACAAVTVAGAWSRWGQSGQSQWFSAFNGYGSIATRGSGSQQVITLSPGTARNPHDTHAALVLTKAWYRDFVTTLRVRTLRQLRNGAAGPPNPWEVGWVVWDYTSNQRFYALTLEPTGWLLSKQDPAYPGDERFLASGKLPRFPVGVTHTIGIVKIGNQITVSGDGRLLTRFTDTQGPYPSGAFGAYAEDSTARFSHIVLKPLPTAAPN